MARRNSALGRQVRDLVRTLTTQGWRVHRNRRTGTVMAFPPDPALPPVAIHWTPSDHRAARNLRAQLRRSGADL